VIVVTGAAGFIGSNLIQHLNEQGRDDIIAVDDLSDGHKFRNLVDLNVCDYFDKDDFLHRVERADDLGQIDAILHQGACSDTTEWDGRYMMDINFAYSKALLSYAQARKIPFIYASSAAVYGGSEQFVEQPENERPLNVYGYSKLLFDRYVGRMLDIATAQVVGLRYFNVYGPKEQHKGSMASVAYHFSNQVQDTGMCQLFAGYDGYKSGEQRRDFVYVGDIVKIITHFLNNPNVSGVFNAGTGKSQTFNDIANAVIAWHGHGQKQYIPFPEHLRDSYQSFTEADLTALRATGYKDEFQDVQAGVTAYLDAVAASYDA